MVLNNPHNHHLSNPLSVGAVVVVKGVASPRDNDWITLNLSQSSNGTDASHIPLQFGIRFPDNVVVLNTKNDQWEEEERHKNTAKLGEPVDIRVIAGEDAFTIMLNRKEIAQYKYRMPLGNITDVWVAGAIEIKGVSCGGRRLGIPFENNVDNFGRNSLLYISGDTEKKAKRFTINLHNRGGDIVMQFDPRFGDKAVVRNSFSNNEWGSEERGGEFPFATDTVFDVAFMNAGDSFVVYVNDVEFTRYAFRLGDNEVTRVHISGDIDNLHTVDVLRA